jgi:hypothetical protein
VLDLACKCLHENGGCNSAADKFVVTRNAGVQLVVFIRFTVLNGNKTPA